MADISFDDLVPTKGPGGTPPAPAPVSFDDLIPKGAGTPGSADLPVQPAYDAPGPVQGGLFGFNKGITNILGTPGAMAQAAIQTSPTAQLARAGVGVVAKKMQDVLASMGLPAQTPTTPFEAATQKLATDPIGTVAGAFTPDKFQNVARSAGILPQDPNYKDDSLISKIDEFIPGAVLPELAAGGGGATPFLARAAGRVGGIFGPAAQEAVTTATAPVARALPAVAGTVGAAAGEQADPNGVIGPLAGGLLAATPGMAAKGIQTIASKVAPDMSAGLGAVLDRYLSGGTVGDANKAFAPAYVDSSTTRTLKEAAAKDPEAGTKPGIFGPQITPQQQAANDIEANAPKLEANGFQPTTASVTDNTGVKAALGAMGRQNPAAMERTTQNNQEAISQGLSDATAPAGATPENPQGTPATASADYFASRFGERTVADKGAVAGAKKNVAAAEAAPVAGGENLPANAGSENAALAASNARDTLLKNKATAKADVDSAYALVPKNTPIEMQPVRDAVDSIRATTGDNEDLPGLVSRVNQSRNTPVASASASGAKAADPSLQAVLDRLLGKQGTGPKTFKPTPFWQAQSDLRAINGAMDAARISGNSNDVRVLGKLKDAYNESLEGAGAGNDALNSANAKYRSYASTFKDDEAGQALAYKTAPENTISGYLRTGAPQRGGKQLAAGLGGDTSAVRTDAFNQLQKKYGDSPTSEQVNQFLSDHGDSLGAYPALKQEIQTFGDNIATKEGSVTAAKGAQEEAESGAKATAAEQAEHPAAPFVEGAKSNYLNGKTPVQAVSEIFNGQGSTLTKMKALVTMAARDTTGKATEGLKNAVSQYLNEKRSRGQISGDYSASPLTGNRNVSSAKLGAALESGDIDSESRKALSLLYSKDEMNKLDMVHKQVRSVVSQNTKNTNAANSNTAQNIANDSTVKSLFGQLGGTKAKEIIQSLGIGGDFAKAKASIQGAALTDPRVAAAMLRRPDAPGTIAALKTALAPHFRGAMEGAASAAGNSALDTNTKRATPSATTSVTLPKPQASTSTKNPDLTESEGNHKALSASEPWDAAAHVMDKEGTSTTQDGKKEYFGFRAGEGTGYDQIRRMVLQKGADAPETKQLVSTLLAGRAAKAGADRFEDDGVKAAVTTIAHMRGEGGARAIMAAVAGAPLRKGLAQLPPSAVDAINQMDPSDFQDKLRKVRESYDRQFYWNEPRSVVVNGQTRNGTFGGLFGKGLLNRYNDERNEFLNVSNPKA